MPSFTLNDQTVEVPAGVDDVPLLWFLREHLNLTGTKFGCGQSECYACTVMIDGEATTSCGTSMSSVYGKKVTTIEGLSKPSEKLHPVQEAWLETGVAQCGYCQPGQIMATISLLQTHPQPTDDQITSALSANLCRCGTYSDIKKAVHLAAQKMART